MSDTATTSPRDARKLRRAKSKADKAKRRRAARRSAAVRAFTARRLARERKVFAGKRKRQIELHGLDGVRALIRVWRRESYERHRGSRPRFVTVASKGPETMAAIDAARGNLRAARAALGVVKSVLHNRIDNGVVTIGGEAMSVRAWLDRTWPQRAGHRATPVLNTWSVDGERVYVLAAHNGFADGEHVNRVPAVGKVRGRVVCKVCKEKRNQ